MRRLLSVCSAGARRLARRPSIVGWLALVAAAGAAPLFNDPYILGVALDIVIFAVLAVGMNIVVGYAGLLDLGYAAFFAIGAYVTAMLMQYTTVPFWLAWPLSGIVAGIFGLIIGAPTLRLRTDYLAMVTLGFGEITRLVITNVSITGGPTGLYNIRPPEVWGHMLESQVQYYFLGLVMLAVGLAFSVWVRQSRLGAAWTYVRHDEEVAQSVGVNPLTVKLAAYGLGAIWGGLAGALFVEALTAVSPTSFTFTQSLLVVMAVILGGQGSLLGAVIGSILVVGLPEVLRQTVTWRLLVFGVALVALMIWRPLGLIKDAPSHGVALIRKDDMPSDA